MAAKLKDTPYVKVIISNRNPQDETESGFVGGNMVIIDGKPSIKHFRFQLDKEIEIPEPFVTQLENRAMIAKGKDGRQKRIPIYNVERIK